MKIPLLKKLTAMLRSPPSIIADNRQFDSPYGICYNLTMKFTSTRDKNNCVDFSDAILKCMPKDGGLYVPSDTEDLRKWILYTDENTSFQSIAGTLTSAFINDEFSPIICETIAMKAFKFVPEFRQLDENLFLLELTHGPTGRHRDFGSFYLTSVIETILQLNGGSSVFLDVSTGELGASLALALRGKKNIKAVLVYPKGCVRGMIESDFVWNGGNIIPVEVDGTINDCYSLMREIFADRKFISERHITVANTANIGRLMPQTFFYPFAFSRIKNKIHSDIFYALAPGNYSNIVAGLYSWQFALPLNGFIVPSTDALSADAAGNPIFLDSMVPIEKRLPADPSSPSNLERLEEVFSANSLMMRHFIYPVAVKDENINAAAKELFMKYNVYADRHTARGYAAYKLCCSTDKHDGFATVLIARDHPSISEEYIRRTIGEVPEMPKTIKESFVNVKLNRPYIKSATELRAVLENI